MKTHDNYNGVFLSTNAGFAGHLRVAGSDSLIKVVGDAPLHRRTSEYEDIHGLLGDGTKASLLNCVSHGWTEHYLGGNSQFESTFFPNYVVVGDQHIGSNEPVIRAIRYHFENVDSLVSGFKTFASVRPHPDDFRKLVEDDHQRLERYSVDHGWPKIPFDPEIGDHPHLVYYSGKWEIVACDTDVAKISLTNRTSYGMGTAAGIGITNEVTANIEFAEPKKLREAVRTLYTLHGLFELSLGHRQRYRWIELELTHRKSVGTHEMYQTAKLYWSLCNKRVEGSSRTHLTDVLLAPDRRPEEFSKVVVSWMNSASTMGGPRERFATAFFENYGIDRLVGAANMFDLLPANRAPESKAVDIALGDAVLQSRKLFIGLPDSTARSSVLSALGRVGKASLPDKVYYRADKVLAESRVHFPELHLPCKYAVLARNHYVHGAPASFDYQEHFTEFVFLTDTLEFVFAVSDLLELGWDFRGWISNGTTMSHAFGAYIVNYADNLRRLKVLLEK